MSHPDLPAEQAYLDHACQCLDRMREVLIRSAGGGLLTRFLDAVWPAPRPEQVIRQLLTSRRNSIT